MSSVINQKSKRKKRKAPQWFKSRIGKNVFRRIYNSITGECLRQYFKIESQVHAMSLYSSQDNGYRYDENKVA